jgi:hypothetical protein
VRVRDERDAVAACSLASDQGQYRHFTSHFVLPPRTRTRVANGDAPAGTLSTAMASPWAENPMYCVCGHSLPNPILSIPLLSFSRLSRVVVAADDILGFRGGGARCGSRQRSRGDGSIWGRCSRRWRASRRRTAADLHSFSRWRRAKGASGG